VVTDAAAVTAAAGGAGTADIIRLAGAGGERSAGAAVVARQDTGRRAGAEQKRRGYIGLGFNLCCGRVRRRTPGWGSQSEGPPHMIAYRLYQVDRNNRLDGPPRVIECESDDAALIEARRYVGGHGIEIWRGDKRIGLIATDSAASRKTGRQGACSGE